MSEQEFYDNRIEELERRIEELEEEVDDLTRDVNVAEDESYRLDEENRDLRFAVSVLYKNQEDTIEDLKSMIASMESDLSLVEVDI